MPSRLPPTCKKRRVVHEGADVVVQEYAQTAEEASVHVIFPPYPDHDYAVEYPDMSAEIQLIEARKEIEKLQLQLQKSKLERFGLARFSSNDKLIQFYTGFPNYKLLEKFIELVKPNAKNMKTWSQAKKEKYTRASPNVFRNYSLCIEDQLFIFLCKVRLGCLRMIL